MQLTALETLVKRYGFDDGDPVTEALNRAMFSVINYSDWDWLYNRVGNVTMGPSDTTLVNVPTDIFKIASLRNEDKNYKLTMLSARGWDSMIEDETVRGAPQYYAIIASQIYIYPRANVATTFSLTYQRGITAMSAGTDEPVDGIMPDNLQYVLPDGAAAWLLRMENEEDRAAVAQSVFDNELQGSLGRDVSDLDGPRTVQDTQGYYC